MHIDGAGTIVWAKTRCTIRRRLALAWFVSFAFEAREVYASVVHVLSVVVVVCVVVFVVCVYVCVFWCLWCGVCCVLFVVCVCFFGSMF